MTISVATNAVAGMNCTEEYKHMYPMEAGAMHVTYQTPTHGPPTCTYLVS